MNLTPYAAHVLAVYYRSSPAEKSAGFTWYDRAHQLALELDPTNVHRAAGVIAATSPLTPWWRNVELAKRTYALGALPGGTFGANVAKVNRIMAGEHPSAVLTSNKVGNFYRNIAEPLNPNGVTIDRHAFDIAVGEVTDDKARRALERKGEYERFSDIYRAAAIVAGVAAPALQAITWVAWRNEKGIK